MAMSQSKLDASDKYRKNDDKFKFFHKWPLAAKLSERDCNYTHSTNRPVILLLNFNMEELIQELIKELKIMFNKNKLVQSQRSKSQS